MKTRIKENEQEKQFKPFTIEVDVESLGELKTLWHMFNAPKDLFYSVKYDCECNYTSFPEKYLELEKGCFRKEIETWNLLDEKLKEHYEK